MRQTDSFKFRILLSGWEDCAMKTNSKIIHWFSLSQKGISILDSAKPHWVSTQTDLRTVFIFARIEFGDVAAPQFGKWGSYSTEMSIRNDSRALLVHRFTLYSVDAEMMSWMSPYSNDSHFWWRFQIIWDANRVPRMCLSILRIRFAIQKQEGWWFWQRKISE